MQNTRTGLNRHKNVPDLSVFQRPLCYMSATVLYNQDGSVSVVTMLRAGQLMISCTIPGRGWIFFLLRSAQTESGAHPTFYPMGTPG